MGGTHRIGMTAAAGVTDGGDVIDVDAKAKCGRHEGPSQLKSYVDAPMSTLIGKELRARPGALDSAGAKPCGCKAPGD
jgi:hypothetical protein